MRVHSNRRKAGGRQSRNAVLLLGCLCLVALFLFTRWRSIGSARGLEQPVVMLRSLESPPPGLLPSAPTVAASSASPLIPRIIHQNYLGGKAAMNADAASSRAHFKRDWWRSCQTHNNRWEYKLWDSAAAEAFLQKEHPWFLPVFHGLDSFVLQSDAIRAFILLSYGGLYLDLDTECLQPVESTLQGHSLVLQAEEDGLVNNAQMASVAAHPIWWMIIKRAVIAFKTGQKDPLYAAGPHAVTSALREYLGAQSGPQASMVGSFKDPSAQTRTIQVYGTAQWFTPCRWNDWSCIPRLARCKALVRRGSGTKAMQARVGETGLQGSNKTQLAALISTCQQFGDVVGAHHFSGSWLGLDGTKAGWIEEEAVQGVLVFLSSKLAFEEHPSCSSSSSSSSSSSEAASSGLDHRRLTPFEDVPKVPLKVEVPAQPRWAQPCALAVLQRIKQQQGGACEALSVVRLRAWQSSGSACGGDGCSFYEQQVHRAKQVLRSMLRAGCLTDLVTDAEEEELKTLTDGIGEGLDRSLLKVHSEQLSLIDNPHAPVPSVSLGTLLLRSAARQQPPAAHRLAVLDISCPGSCVHEVIGSLHTQGSDVLERGPTQPAVLLLHMGGLQAPQRHLAYAFYQHLYQESGFLGYLHEALALPAQRTNVSNLDEPGSDTLSTLVSTESPHQGQSSSTADAPKTHRREARGDEHVPLPEQPCSVAPVDSACDELVLQPMDLSFLQSRLP